MVEKESLHLGQKVLVGKDRKPATIDGLTQNYAGVIMDEGGLDLVEYREIYTE